MTTKEELTRLFGARENFKVHENDGEFDTYVVVSWTDAGRFCAADSYYETTDDVASYDTEQELNAQIDDCLSGNKETFESALEKAELPELKFSSYDFGHWGVTDPYEDSEKIIREALSSGSDFDTGWQGSKKELDSIRIRAFKDKILLEVSMDMDEIPDIIYDAEENLSEEEESEVADLLDADMEFTTSTSESIVLDRDASYESIMEKAGEMIDSCGKFLDEEFESVKAAVSYIKGLNGN